MKRDVKLQKGFTIDGKQGTPMDRDWETGPQ